MKCIIVANNLRFSPRLKREKTLQQWQNLGQEYTLVDYVDYNVLIAWNSFGSGVFSSVCLDEGHTGLPLISHYAQGDGRTISLKRIMEKHQPCKERRICIQFTILSTSLWITASFLPHFLFTPVFIGLRRERFYLRLSLAFVHNTSAQLKAVL